MKGLVPEPRPVWTEAEGRRLVLGRAAQNVATTPCCEACGAPAPLEWSHRIARSRGGTWAPSNGIAMCRRCHAWAHVFPDTARTLGWHLRTNDDPTTQPAWLARPYRGFWLLEDVDAIVRAAHPEDHPGLPDVYALSRLLPRWVMEAAE